MSFPTSPTDDCKSAATKWTCISTATTHIAQHPVTLNLPASGESHDNRPGILEIRQLTGVQDAWTASPVDGPSPPDKSPATSAPQAGGWVTRSRFSWKRGFLTNHKLPTRQRTPASMPHNHMPPTQPQSNNTPLALLRHGKKVSTAIMDGPPQPRKGRKTQRWYCLCLAPTSPYQVSCLSFAFPSAMIYACASMARMAKFTANGKRSPNSSYSSRPTTLQFSYCHGRSQSTMVTIQP